MAYTCGMGRIVTDPEVCSGKPVIAGTRILVSVVLGQLAGGYSIERVIQSFPELSRDDVIAAIEYATALVDQQAARSA